MHFYKDEQGDIFCAPCAGDLHQGVGLPDLKYVGFTGVPEGLFKCASCDERFMVYDGRVFMEVT